MREGRLGYNSSMEMNPAREWYLVGTPYCGDLEYIRARIPE